uniref:G_PROTEIN_RECEP_F1_2 domain-containing protein n=1 Tax=Haemonchus contortus TaxID=6289 RepID=A0A7I5EBM6_HAECO
PDILSIPFQVFYIVIPTISLIGNSAIVYVTVRSRSLRSPCNILIGLISLGEGWHMLGHYVMVASHNIIENHLMRQDYCVYWQVIPTLGMCFSSILLLNVAADRLIATQKF